MIRPPKSTGVIATADAVVSYAYETTVIPVTVSGWQCCDCLAVWAEQHSAAYCCAKSAPCTECGGRTEDRHDTLCRACRDARQHAALRALPRLTDVDARRENFWFAPDNLPFLTPRYFGRLPRSRLHMVCLCVFFLFVCVVLLFYDSFLGANNESAGWKWNDSVSVYVRYRKTDASKEILNETHHPAWSGIPYL